MIGVEQYEELVGAQVDTPRGTLLTKPEKALTDEAVTVRKQPKRTTKRNLLANTEMILKNYHIIM